MNAFNISPVCAEYRRTQIQVSLTYVSDKVQTYRQQLMQSKYTVGVWITKHIAYKTNYM